MKIIKQAICSIVKRYHAYIVYCGFNNIIIFFFNDTATTEIYTLSLHDALPISEPSDAGILSRKQQPERRDADDAHVLKDRKSTRLNSSHGYISYAVFCLKKKKLSKKYNKINNTSSKH